MPYRGIVLDQSGVAVAGAQVYTDDSACGKIKTDIHGLFEFPSCHTESGPLFVTARKDNRYVSDKLEKEAFAPLRFGPMTEVDLLVLSESDRRPIVNASVTILMDDSFIVHTGADGLAKIFVQSGFEKVTITSGDFIPYTLDVISSKRKETKTVLLQTGVAINGFVKNRDGEGIADVQVFTWSTADERALSAKTDSLGRWQIAHMQDGLYIFLAANGNHLFGTSEPVRVSQDGTMNTKEISIEVREKKPQGRCDLSSDSEPLVHQEVCEDTRRKVRGTVLDPEGKLVRGAEVYLHYGPWEADFAREGVTDTEKNVADENGLFEFAVEPEKPSFLFARWPASPPGGGLRKVDVTVIESTTQDVRLVLARGGQIEGTLQFSDGTVPRNWYLVEDAAVKVVSVNEQRVGHFVLSALSPGGQYITLQGDEFLSKVVYCNIPEEGKTVNIEPVVLDRGIIIEGDVLDETGVPVYGAHVSADPNDYDFALLSLDSETGVASTNKDGHFRHRVGLESKIFFVQHKQYGSRVLRIDEHKQLNAIVLARSGSVCGLNRSETQPSLRLEGFGVDLQARLHGLGKRMYCFEALAAGHYCLALDNDVFSENVGHRVATESFVPERKIPALVLKNGLFCFDLKAGEQKTLDMP